MTRNAFRPRRLAVALVVGALSCLALPAVASAADWQLQEYDGDVYADAALLDADDNGRAEQYWFDIDNDGGWDTHLYNTRRADDFLEVVTYDMNENTRPEYLLLDIDQRQGFEWVYFDPDQDGRWNFRRIIPGSTLDATTRLNNLNATREQLRAFQYRTGQSVRNATYPIL